MPPTHTGIPLLKLTIGDGTPQATAAIALQTEKAITLVLNYFAARLGKSDDKGTQLILLFLKEDADWVLSVIQQAVKQERLYLADLDTEQTPPSPSPKGKETSPLLIHVKYLPHKKVLCVTL